MKLIIGFNAIVFGSLLSVSIIEGLPREYWEQIIVVMLVLTPLINTLYILKIKTIDGNGLSSDWISLYFRRKRLEEEKKIQDLKDDRDGEL